MGETILKMLAYMLYFLVNVSLIYYVYKMREETKGNKASEYDFRDLI